MSEFLSYNQFSANASSLGQKAIAHGKPLRDQDKLPKTLPDALKRAVISSPDKGIVYIQSDDSNVFQSYPELLEDAQKILAGLRKQGLKPQDKVIFQLPKNQEFIATFWGCLLGGFVPVPMEVAPNYIDTNNAVQKLQNVWRMLDKPLIIVSEEIEDKVINFFKTADINNFKIKSCSSLKDNEPDTNWHHSKPEDLALLLLTSGSTGTPKGVQLSHRVILYRAAIASQRHKTHRDTVSINWLPLDHVSGIAQFHVRDIYSGCQQIHAPTDMFLEDPIKWLDWIDRYKVNISWSPNFAYGLVNKQSERILQGNWNLSSMQIFLNAGEAIAPQTARKFMELLIPHGLPQTAMHPAWGMSETAGAIVYSDRYSLDTPDDQFVETGTPAPDLSIRVVDGENKVVSEGIIGTLQIKGEMVTSGYYQNPEANEAAFTDDGWFNTGDVAFIREGRLTIAGRRKDIIIINGLNYYCHEIEAVVEDIKGVEVSYTAACGFRPSDSDTDKLAIFFHPQDNGDLLELIDRIRSTVVKSIGVNPTHLIPVAKDAIPKTGIGKIQRAQLKQRFEAGEFEPILKEIETLNHHSNKRSPQDIPSNNLTEKIAEIWRSVFGMADIGYQDNFFELGGHSILATQLIGRLRKEFAIELSLQVLLSSPTVAELAAVIAANLGEQTLNPEVDLPQIENGLADLNEPFPLNDIQQAYWLGRDPSFELGNIGTHAYGEMDCFGLDLERFKWIVQYLIDHHSMLRAIVLPDGQQQILAEVPPYELKVTDLSNLDTIAQEEQLQATREELSHQVFSLHEWPLFEVRANILGNGKTRLYLSLDLLIADASTLQTLRQQLLHLYFHPQPELPKMGVSFRDYILAERALEKREDYLKAERYWFDRIDSLPPAPDLPLAVYPSQIDKPHFKRRRYRLEPKLWQALQKRGRRVGLTSSGILLTAFADVLTLWNRRTHFTLNLTTFNRLPIHPQVNDLVGDFTYLNLLEVDFRQQMPFEARAQQLQQQLFEDLDHRQYNGLQVLRELNLHRGGKSKVTMPVIFTSFLGLPQKEDLGTSKTIDRIGEVVYALSQTSQAWIDHIVFEEHGAMVCCWDVVDALFPDGLIDDLFAAYCGWVEQLATDETAWQRVERAHLLPEAQRQQRAEVNATEFPLTDDLLHSLFVEQVPQRPQQTAVITPERSLTYAELYQLAHKLAHRLRQQGAKPNQLVAIILEKGWRQVVAVAGVLMSGAAYVPIDVNFPPQRQQQVLEQSQAKLIVSTQDWLDSNQSSNCEILVIDEILAQSSENLPPLTWVQKPEDLAYVVFTSGSTGTPKGVAIHHRGAVNSVLDLNRRFNVTPEDRSFALAALNFDLSVYDIFGLLAAGGTIVMPEADKVKEPAHWADLMHQHRISILNIVPTFAQMLAEYVSAEGMAVPQGLRVAMLNGDWAPLSLPGKLWKLWPEMNVSNLGGATEGSILSIAYCVKEIDPKWISIPYGKPMDNQYWAVLNKQLDPCPVWVFGDLYIGGTGLALGYWQDPERTAASFITHPVTGERLYRTGDLGRYFPDGNIELLGREDNQVKIRGFRIELGEIESVFNQHPLVKQTVVHTVGEGTNKQLAAYVVCHSESAGNISEAQDPVEGTELALEVARPQQGLAFESQQSEMTLEEELLQYVSAYLPDYMVPTYVVQLEKIPVSPNGKVARKSLPIPNLKSTEGKVFLAPQTPSQEIIAKIVETTLKIERIGLHDNLFEQGANSLTVTQIMIRLRTAFGLEIPLRVVFESPTVAELDKALANDLSSSLAIPPITPIQRDGTPIPLSYAQERLWFLAQWEESSAAYNGLYAFQLDGYLNVKALQQAVDELVSRQQILQTSFTAVNGTPVQQINPALRLPIKVIEASSLEMSLTDWLNQENKKLFALEIAPLLQLTLLRWSESKNLLVFKTHHTIFDGWAIDLLMGELSQLYQAHHQGKSSPLPLLPVQYADYTLWQRKWFQGEEIASQLSYWQQQLASAPVLLDLPTDHPRPAIQTFQGSSYTKKLPLELSQQVYNLAQQQGVTIFMTLLTSFQLLLHRYSGQSDILVGAPIANRQQAELESLIGTFANTLVMRTQIEDRDSVTSLLHKVRKMALEAYSNQDAPFERVVEALQPERNLAHSPLFQVMLILQNTAMNELELSGVDVTPLTPEIITSKFDLTLFIEESEQGIKAIWEYNSDLFEADTIQGMASHWETVLRGMVEDPSQPVATLPLLSAAEQQQLLVDWNDTQADYPDLCIHQLFEQQVAKTPNAVALKFEGQELTYTELNQKSNQLAHYLQKLGVKPDTLVGICLERSVEMIVGLLGILKAGGAYVPIDPTYPSERLALMLSDSQVSFLVTEEKLTEHLPKHEARAIYLDTDWQDIARHREDNPVSNINPENLAYVIYTSGSTGTPKGVLINHGNVVRLFTATQSWFNFNENDVWTMFHSYAFDFSVWEIWGALLHGGRLVVVPYVVSRSPEAFYKLLAKEKVTVLNQTPSAFRQLIWAEERVKITQKLNLRLVIFGGEALEIQSLKPWFDRHGDQTPQLVNMYGITETTVHVTYRPLTKADLNNTGSAIGIPIPNLRVYILDRYLQPVPMGVPGEMYVAGAGLARGYLHRPELTAERFINPSLMKNVEGMRESPLGDVRLYKTGDLGKYLPDGSIEYVGRSDNQVKIRGFRIELGEIEALLAQYPDIKQNVVIVREDVPGDKRLVAYVVPKQNETITREYLRNFLQETLPTYMIPGFFVILEQMPLTPNGKCDHNNLPKPEGNILNNTYVQPQTEIEAKIAAVWQDLLKVDRVGIHDNFFDLGGHSLLIAQVHSQLTDILKQEIPMLDIFTYPTIHDFAKNITRSHKESVTQFNSNRAKKRNLRKAAVNNKRQLRQSRRDINDFSEGNGNQ